MVKRAKSSIRAAVRPTTPREPLFIRLCHLFLENLTNLLRIGLVVGSILLVQDLRILFVEAQTPIADAEPAALAPDVVEDPPALVAPEPVLTEGVMQALNCTYEAYRKSHYDECVQDNSRIYKRPQADPDDTGLVLYEPPVLYAYQANPEQQQRLQ